MDAQPKHKGRNRKEVSFEYIVIDKAHRIKNMNSILSQIVCIFISRGRLLITRTPLQNNLKEVVLFYEYGHAGPFSLF